MTDRVGIGIAGIGVIADLDVPGYLEHPDCDVVAVADPRVDKVRPRAEAWGVDTVHASLDELLADDRVDAVELLTPTFLHHEHVLAAIAAGKPVSVQKPIANTVVEGRAMIEAAQAAGVPFRINENCCHFPPLERARQLIQEGAIGTPTVIRIKTVVGRGESEFQAEVDPASYEWRLDTRSPGGHLFDDVIHKYSMALWLVDEPVRSVQAVVRRGPLMFETPTVALWEYERDDLLGMMEVSHAPAMLIPSPQYGADEFFEIQGTHGLLWVTRCTGELAKSRLPALLWFKEDGTTQDFPDVDVPYEVSHRRASAAWVEAVRDGTYDAVDLSPQTALEALQLCFAVYQASDQGVKVDPRTIEDSYGPPWWPPSVDDLIADYQKLSDWM
jgi:predicted dehydrogenase